MFKHTKEFASEKSVSRVCIPVMMFVVGLVSSFDAFGIYYSNPEINRLIAEKQAKMAQLETCTKKVKGFKIAGISTIGLTTVGVGANIVMASKESQLSDELERARGELNEKKWNEQQQALEEARRNQNAPSGDGDVHIRLGGNNSSSSDGSVTVTIPVVSGNSGDGTVTTDNKSNTGDNNGQSQNGGDANAKKQGGDNVQDNDKSGGNGSVTTDDKSNTGDNNGQSQNGGDANAKKQGGDNVQDNDKSGGNGTASSDTETGGDKGKEISEDDQSNGASQKGRPGPQKKFGIDPKIDFKTGLPTFLNPKNNVGEKYTEPFDVNPNLLQERLDEDLEEFLLQKSAQTVSGQKGPGADDDQSATKNKTSKRKTGKGKKQDEDKEQNAVMPDLSQIKVINVVGAPFYGAKTAPSGNDKTGSDKGEEIQNSWDASQSIGILSNKHDPNPLLNILDNYGEPLGKKTQTAPADAQSGKKQVTAPAEVSKEEKDLLKGGHVHETTHSSSSFVEGDDQKSVVDMKSWSTVSGKAQQAAEWNACKGVFGIPEVRECSGNRCVSVVTLKNCVKWGGIDLQFTQCMLIDKDPYWYRGNYSGKTALSLADFDDNCNFKEDKVIQTNTAINFTDEQRAPIVKEKQKSKFLTLAHRNAPGACKKPRENNIKDFKCQGKRCIANVELKCDKNIVRGDEFYYGACFLVNDDASDIRLVKHQFRGGTPGAAVFDFDDFDDNCNYREPLHIP